MTIGGYRRLRERHKRCVVCGTFLGNMDYAPKADKCASCKKLFKQCMRTGDFAPVMQMKKAAFKGATT